MGQPSAPPVRQKTNKQQQTNPQVQWVTKILEKAHPKFSIKTDSKKNFKYLIDTGADKTILI